MEPRLFQYIKYETEHQTTVITTNSGFLYLISVWYYDGVKPSGWQIMKKRWTRSWEHLLESLGLKKSKLLLNTQRSSLLTWKCCHIKCIIFWLLNEQILICYSNITHVTVWVSLASSSFLPQSKNMCVRLLKIAYRCKCLFVSVLETFFF